MAAQTLGLLKESRPADCRRVLTRLCDFQVFQLLHDQPASNLHSWKTEELKESRNLLEALKLPAATMESLSRCGLHTKEKPSKSNIIISNRCCII